MRLLPPLGLCSLAVSLAALAVAIAPQIGTVAAPVPRSFKPTIEPARHKSYTQAIAGTRARFDMVAIPGGTFLMGSPDSEKDRGSDEGPRHPVTVRPFWMGKLEVSWAEYDLFRQGGPPSERGNEAALMKDADAITRPTLTYPDPTFGYGGGPHPAIVMSHHGAMEYCRWLSRKTGQSYRLPTEAEWEWAARAGTTTTFFFGDDPRQLGDYAWFAANSKEMTHPGGKKKPNPWGLYDVYGNVAEWCLDYYEKDYYAAFSRRRPTLAPVNLPRPRRFPNVVRGGSWDDAAARCRSAARLASSPTWNRIDPDQPKSLWWLWNCDFVGFRVVRAVSEQRELQGIRSKVTKKSD